MALLQLKRVQHLPMKLSEAWDFFSSPMNLQTITPASLNFQILTDLQGSKMYAGQLIEYIVKPVFGIPLHWVTEITHLKKHKYFVDEQRFGPYKLWHHQHHFEELNNGVKMTDLVHYALPGGILGRMIGGGFVKKQVEGIFDYRNQKLQSLFPGSKAIEA